MSWEWWFLLLIVVIWIFYFIKFLVDGVVYRIRTRGTWEDYLWDRLRQRRRAQLVENNY